MEFEQFASLMSKGPASAYGAVLLYFIWQVKNSISHMGSTIDELRDSVNKLNLTLSSLANDQQRDRRDFERLRDDFEDFKEKHAQ